MKKQTKGAIAAGAAVLLLAGGAGTMAAWSDSVTVGGGSVNSGELSIDQTGTPAWAFATPDKTTVPYLPGTSLIAPGDIVTYTAAYDIKFAGTNLEATLEADLDSITGTGVLLDWLEVDLAATVGTTATPLPTDGQAIAITAPGTVNVVVTFTFDELTPGTTAQGESASLENFNLDLKQTKPAAA